MTTTNNATDNFVNYQPTFAQGATLTLDSITTITVNPGIVKDFTGVYNIVNSVFLNLNITSSGANGLDTGSVGANQIYSIYLIADSTNVNPVASLASLSVTNVPTTLPSGYDIYRRIGWWQTLNDNSLAIFFQSGIYNARKYYYQGPRSAAGSGGFTFLSGGSATVSTPVGISTYIPINCKNIGLQVSFTGTLPFQFVSIKDDVSPTYENFVVSQNSGLSPEYAYIELHQTTPKFDYVNSAAGCSTQVDLLWYIDEI
jgi:hypothetical protein